MKRKVRTPAQKKIAEVMHEFKEGELHSGKSDTIVTNPKQAIAIALSEAKELEEDTAEKKDSQKHGIISVVQSSDEGVKKTENINTSLTENKLGNTEKYGIISVVQSPDEETIKQ